VPDPPARGAAAAAGAGELKLLPELTPANARANARANASRAARGAAEAAVERSALAAAEATGPLAVSRAVVAWRAVAHTVEQLEQPKLRMAEAERSEVADGGGGDPAGLSRHAASEAQSRLVSDHFGGEVTIPTPRGATRAG
jgi:hypothetical protein